jgi:hypothetical protein
LRKTVKELLDGVPGPLSNDEYMNWMALANLEEKERKASEQKGKARRGRRR